MIPDTVRADIGTRADGSQWPDWMLRAWHQAWLKARFEQQMLIAGCSYLRDAGFSAWYTFHEAGALAKWDRRNNNPCYMHKTFQDF